MSSESRPISPTRFREAISDLPLSSLYAKASELRNSIAHLNSSNEQLLPYARDGDKDCKEAILENEEVIQRMQDRILMLQVEVEGRGMQWIEDDAGKKEEVVHASAVGQDVNIPGSMGQQSETVNGARNRSNSTEEDGVHL
jgi:hypothetical protein